MIIKYGLAKAVTNHKGIFMDRGVLDQLEAGDVVRLSLHVPGLQDDEGCVDMDAPYVMIREKEGEELCGLVMDKERTEAEHMYPVRTGERIWFKRANVYQIATDLMGTKRNKALQRFQHKERRHVDVTGPLQLVEYE